MYELLLRTETLLLGLEPLVLLGIGLGALVVGLLLWLGGTRYSTAIIGLLGAVVGSGAGLVASQWLNAHPILGMLIGAAVLATLSILLKKVLILVLAVLVISAVSGAGYISVLLDRAAPPAPAETRQATAYQYQSFRAMEPESRLAYMDEISEEKTFGDRLDALLTDTWNAIRPYGWMVLIAIIAGAVAGFVLVWLIAKVIIALAYSIVGAAAMFIGAQATLLTVNFPAVSSFNARPWLLPIAFLVVVVIGWVWQLFFFRAKPRKEKPEKEHMEKHE